MAVDKKLCGAINKAYSKFPKVSYDKHTVRLFIGKVGGFYRELSKSSNFSKKDSYNKAVKLSLKEIEVWDKDTQNAYKILAGAYFGPQGGRESGRVRRANKKKGMEKQEIINAKMDEMMQDAIEHEEFHMNRQGK